MIQSAHVKNLTLTVLCAAVLAACGGGGGSTADQLDTQLNNVRAAQTVSAQIAALAAPENLTVNDEAAVNSAVQAYNKLPDDQKAYISSESVATLEAAIQAMEANREAAAKVTGTVNSLPDTAAEIDTPAEEKLLTDANAAYSALTDNQKTWLAAQTEKKLSTLAASLITDNNSLAPLSLPAPLHTAFISSAGAQQHNPHTQLRTVDGKPDLRDDQIGLIRTLAINPNASVIVDGAVLSGNQSVEYRTPASGSTKVSSAGSTQIDREPLNGKSRNYSPVTTSQDSKIAAAYIQKEEAYKALLEAVGTDVEKTGQVEAYKNALTAYQDLVDLSLGVDTGNKVNNQSERAKAEQDKDTAYNNLKEVISSDKNMSDALDKFKNSQEEYARLWNERGLVEGNIRETMNTLAFYKKDANGLVFDKAFDGVYIISFTDGTRLVLQDPAAAGWTYQTFAHYVDPKNGVTHGYQSIGDETTDMPTSGTATYKGITTAYLTNNGNNDRQLTANVTAVADFAKRALRFSTDNSQIHALDVNGKRVSTAAAGYDLRANATWAEGGNSFKGDAATVDKNMSGSLNGKFFGGAAAEIGGTYGLKSADGNTQLIGGYGAKRP